MAAPSRHGQARAVRSGPARPQGRQGSLPPCSESAPARPTRGVGEGTPTLRWRTIPDHSWWAAPDPARVRDITPAPTRCTPTATVEGQQGRLDPPGGEVGALRADLVERAELDGRGSRAAAARRRRGPRGRARRRRRPGRARRPSRPRAAASRSAARRPASIVEAELLLDLAGDGEPAGTRPPRRRRRAGPSPACRSAGTAAPARRCRGPASARSPACGGGRSSAAPGSSRARSAAGRWRAAPARRTTWSRHGRRVPGSTRRTPSRRSPPRVATRSDASLSGLDLGLDARPAPTGSASA